MMIVSGAPRRVDLDVMQDERQDTPDEPTSPEDRPDEPGAEGGARSPAADTPPAAPSDDDSAVGDTDQHSDS
jgi:hypothetical protein